MSGRRFRHGDLEATFKVELGRVDTSEHAKERGSVRPAFLQLILAEPDAEPGDFLVDLWDYVDIDLDLNDEELSSLLLAKRDALLSAAEEQAEELRSIRASERSTEQRIEKLLEHVA